MTHQVPSTFIKLGWRSLFCFVPLLALLTCCAPSPEEIAVAKLRPSMERGVQWLLSQQKEDGSFETHKTRFPYVSAMTALALLALHDAGHSPADATEEGRALVAAVDYLCKATAVEVPRYPGLYLGREDRSRMYGHAMITYALATVVNDVPEAQLRIAAHMRVMNAAALILAAQRVTKAPQNLGGWRYEPQSSDSDVSVTAWQLLALRAAEKHASVTVPESAWTEAASFLQRLSLHANSERGMSGALSYEAYGGSITFSTTASGVIALQCCGQGDAPEVRDALAFIDRSEILPTAQWFYYGMNHCSHAMINAEAGQRQRFVARLSEVLVPAQHEDGSWGPGVGNEKSAGIFYATAMAVSALGPWVNRPG